MFDFSVTLEGSIKAQTNILEGGCYLGHKDVHDSCHILRVLSDLHCMMFGAIHCVMFAREFYTIDYLLKYERFKETASWVLSTLQ